MQENLFRFRRTKNLRYISLDCETESLSLTHSRPWSISWIVVENNKIVKEFNKFPLIKDLKVSDGAAAVTGFDINEYKNKSIDPYLVYQELEPYLYSGEYFIIGQNILNFDILQLRNFFDYLIKVEKRKDIINNYSYLNRVYDNLALGRALNLGIQFPLIKEEILSWQYKLCNYRQKGLKASLESLSKQFGLNYDTSSFGHHSAIWDVKQTDLIFRELCNKLEVWG